MTLVFIIGKYIARLEIWFLMLLRVFAAVGM